MWENKSFIACLTFEELKGDKNKAQFLLMEVSALAIAGITGT